MRTHKGWHRLAPLAAALLLRAPAGHAAAYLPGPTEADPPTGDLGAARAEEPIRNGNGIRWEFAPWRSNGSVSLDLRALRLEDGTRTTQATVFNDIEFASYVWQPWFVQVRAGLGLLGTTDSNRSPGADAARSTSLSATGRLSLAVFPLSRFPFELRADVSDSRARGDTLGTDYRSMRLSMTQSYRPETGNDSYSIGFDHSRLDGIGVGGGADTVNTLRGTALRQFVDHSIEVDASWTANDRSDTDDHSRIATLSARHSWHPANDLNVDSLASWNDVRLASRSAAIDTASSIRQVSSVLTWRPREGEPLYSAEAPLTISGSARWVDAGARSGDTEQASQAANATLGVTKEMTRALRLSASVSASVLDVEGQRSSAAAGNGAVAWTPEGVSLGEWRWSPSLGANAGYARGGGAGERRTLGGQASQSVARTLLVGEGESLSLNLTQSLGALHESQSGVTARALAHSAGVFWQAAGSGTSQTFVGLSASDSRTWSQGRGSFQLVNLQASRRTQLGRNESWSGNLTLQASRSDTTQIDPFTGELRTDAPGWQRLASGSLSYEHQRAFGVPRLRFTALLSVDSAQLERRADGDIDAPRERIGESLEARVDYAIGKLDARLAARWARLDGRGVASLFARVQRRY